MINVYCEDITSVNWATRPAFGIETTTIWRLSLSTNHHRTDHLLNLLTEDEKVRAAKYRREKDTKRYILTRSALRSLLARYTKQPAAEIAFFYGDDKKPYLKTGTEYSLHFNVSHSDDFALIAISDQPVGIDIEHINPDFNYQEILTNYSNQAEIREISQSLSPVDTFYKFWTRKEALLKATGKGIIDELAGISVLNGPNAVNGILIGSMTGWNVSSFVIEEEYVASIASGGGPFQFFEVDLEELSR